MSAKGLAPKLVEAGEIDHFAESFSFGFFRAAGSSVALIRSFTNRSISRYRQGADLEGFKVTSPGGLNVEAPSDATTRPVGSPAELIDPIYHLCDRTVRLMFRRRRFDIHLRLLIVIACFRRLFGGMFDDGRE